MPSRVPGCATDNSLREVVVHRARKKSVQQERRNRILRKTARRVVGMQNVHADAAHVAKVRECKRASCRVRKELVLAAVYVVIEGVLLPDGSAVDVREAVRDFVYREEGIVLRREKHGRGRPPR